MASGALLIAAVLALYITDVTSLVVPEELTSVLSVVYSNIPPIKKGTDSRVGFGFSLGNHADFQVMYELGPQKVTAPLSDGTGSDTRKRHAIDDLSPITGRSKDSNSQGSKYLQTWYKTFKNKGRPTKKPQKPEPQLFNLEDAVVDLRQTEDGQFELRQPRPSNMPAAVLDQLKQLYGIPLENSYNSENLDNSGRTHEEAKRITADLSDVSLDDE